MKGVDWDARRIKGVPLPYKWCLEFESMQAPQEHSLVGCLFGLTKQLTNPCIPGVMLL